MLEYSGALSIFMMSTVYIRFLFFVVLLSTPQLTSFLKPLRPAPIRSASGDKGAGLNAKPNYQFSANISKWAWAWSQAGHLSGALFPSWR